MSIYHKHHIVPRHMGGSDDPSNLVELTIEEHAEAHRKLFEQYGHWQDEVAWKGLAKMIDHQEVITEVIRNTNKCCEAQKTLRPNQAENEQLADGQHQLRWSQTICRNSKKDW